MNCENCNQEIPPARLEILPETRVCVNCSDTKPYRAILSGTPSHKGSEMQIVSGDSPVLDYLDDEE